MAETIIRKIKRFRDQFYQDTLASMTGDKAKKNLYLIYRAFNSVFLWGTLMVSTILGSTTVLKVFTYFL